MALDELGANITSTANTQTNANASMSNAQTAAGASMSAAAMSASASMANAQTQAAVSMEEIKANKQNLAMQLAADSIIKRAQIASQDRGNNLQFQAAREKIAADMQMLTQQIASQERQFQAQFGLDTAKFAAQQGQFNASLGQQQAEFGATHQLDVEKFNLDKTMQEAKLAANPSDWVANSFYQRNYSAPTSGPLFSGRVDVPYTPAQMPTPVAAPTAFQPGNPGGAMTPPTGAVPGTAPPQPQYAGAFVTGMQNLLGEDQAAAYGIYPGAAGGAEAMQTGGDQPCGTITDPVLKQLCLQQPNMGPQVGPTPPDRSSAPMQAANAGNIPAPGSSTPPTSVDVPGAIAASGQNGPSQQRPAPPPGSMPVESGDMDFVFDPTSGTYFHFNGQGWVPAAQKQMQPNPVQRAQDPGGYLLGDPSQATGFADWMGRMQSSADPNERSTAYGMSNQGLQNPLPANITPRLGARNPGGPEGTYWDQPYGTPGAQIMQPPPTQVPVPGGQTTFSGTPPTGSAAALGRPELDSALSAPLSSPTGQTGRAPSTQRAMRAGGQPTNTGGAPATPMGILQEAAAAAGVPLPEWSARMAGDEREAQGLPRSPLLRDRRNPMRPVPGAAGGSEMGPMGMGPGSGMGAMDDPSLPNMDANQPLVVGESGPEIIKLPPGAEVIPLTPPNGQGGEPPMYDVKPMNQAAMSAIGGPTQIPQRYDIRAPGSGMDESAGMPPMIQKMAGADFGGEVYQSVNSAQPMRSSMSYGQPEFTMPTAPQQQQAAAPPQTTQSILDSVYKQLGSQPQPDYYAQMQAQQQQQAQMFAQQQAQFQAQMQQQQAQQQAPAQNPLASAPGQQVAPTNAQPAMGYTPEQLAAMPWLKALSTGKAPGSTTGLLPQSQGYAGALSLGQMPALASTYGADFPAVPSPSQLPVQQWLRMNDVEKEMAGGYYRALGIDPRQLTGAIQTSMPGTLGATDRTFWRL